MIPERGATSGTTWAPASHPLQGNQHRSWHHLPLERLTRLWPSRKLCVELSWPSTQRRLPLQLSRCYIICTVNQRVIAFPSLMYVPCFFEYAPKSSQSRRRCLWLTSLVQRWAPCSPTRTRERTSRAQPLSDSGFRISRYPICLAFPRAHNEAT